MSAARFLCDCRSKTFVQTKTIYCNEAEGIICYHCRHYPVRAPQSRALGIDAPDTSNVRDFLEYWEGETIAAPVKGFIFGAHGNE